MKSKEKMVFSTEKSEITKRDIPKLSNKLNSSSTAKKFMKKEVKEKILFSFTDKSSDDFSDSSDFVSPQNREKCLKNVNSLTELSSAASKEQKQTSRRRLFRSSLDYAPLSTRLRTRTIGQEVKGNRTLLTENSELSKSSPAILSISGAAVKWSLASKLTRCYSQESKKKISQTSKHSKIKAESFEMDGKQRQTIRKKSTKSELVKSNAEFSSSTGEKGKVTAGGKDKPLSKIQSSRSRSKFRETLNHLEKTSPKLVISIREKLEEKNSDKNSSQSLAGKLEGPFRIMYPRQGSGSPIYVKKKNKEKKSDLTVNNDSSQILSKAADEISIPNLQLSKGNKKSTSCRSSINADHNSFVECPICEEFFCKEDLGQHTLMCSNDQNAAGTRSQPPKSSIQMQLHRDEIIACLIHEEINRDTLSSKESVGTGEIIFCFVCQKDLSHMNSMRKMKHINQCFDDTEKKDSPKKKKIATTVGQQVPTCPMCSKQFKTAAMHGGQLEKCAEELSVSPQEAFKIIAGQEENFKQSQLATVASSLTSAQSLSNKLNDLPDEQMQIAMVLSSSFFEEEQKKLNEQLADKVINTCQVVNRELGKLKKSRNKVHKSVPMLLTVSKEDQLAQNAQRVDSVISESTQPEHLPRQFKQSSLCLSSKNVHQISENSNISSSAPSFWSRASLMDFSKAQNSFYVQSVMPPIQVDRVTIGSRLKPLSTIPDQGIDKEETPSVSDNLLDSPTVPLTQTAVLLAEFAQSNKGDHNNIECSRSMIKQTQGFYTSHETDNASRTRENMALTALSEDLCKLVNNPHLSDVEFVAADCSHVFAHKLLLSIRCPQILSHAISRNNHLVIEMKDISHNSLLTFLKYLYTGQVNFDKNMTADLLQLSRKFNLLQLASLCEETLQMLTEEDSCILSVESVAGEMNELLETDDNHLELLEDSLEISNDSICFVSENQQNIHNTGMLTALHSVDMVCENSADKDLVLGGDSIKAACPASQPQGLFSNSTIMNGSNAGFRMADTILEFSQTIKDNSVPFRMTAGFPLSETMKLPSPLQESSSKSCTESAKNLKKFSPSSLSKRFYSVEKNSGTDFDSDFEVEKLTSELSTSSIFPFLPKFKLNRGFENEDSPNVISNPHKRRKRKGWGIVSFTKKISAEKTRCV